MKMLVTGGAGFIGSNFIEHVMSEYPDISVACVDSLTYAADMRNLSFARGDARFSFHRVDITDKIGLFKVFSLEKPEIVVNFAAESHVDNSIKNPEPFIKTNVIGTANLMDACLEFSTARFHQVSTDEVYGTLKKDGSAPFTEESLLAPSSPYSASKASADMLVNSYVRTYGLNATVTRSSNNYGKQQYREKLIPLLIEKALSDESFPLYGDGKNVRDWIYVEDHCRAIMEVILRGRSGEVYNVGADCELENVELIRIVLQILGRDDSFIDHVADRAGHDIRYAINHEKITKELGWMPRTPFEEGIEKTVLWYKNLAR